MNKKIFKKNKDELQEYLKFKKGGGKIENKKGKGSYKRKEKYSRFKNLEYFFILKNNFIKFIFISRNKFYKI